MLLLSFPSRTWIAVFEQLPNTRAALPHRSRHAPESGFCEHLCVFGACVAFALGRCVKRSVLPTTTSTRSYKFHQTEDPGCICTSLGRCEAVENFLWSKRASCWQSCLLIGESNVSKSRLTLQELGKCFDCICHEEGTLAEPVFPGLHWCSHSCHNLHSHIFTFFHLDVFPSLLVLPTSPHRLPLKASERGAEATIAEAPPNPTTYCHILCCSFWVYYVSL